MVHEPTHLPIFPTHSTCTSCALHTVARSVGIATIHLPDSLPPSSTTPAVLFLGQNPGFNEDLTGTPFVGRSGALLRGGWFDPSTGAPTAPNTGAHLDGAYIDGIGLRSLASIYLTNVCRCYTMDNAKPGWKSHLVPCFPYTTADILTIARAHAPAPIILFCISAPAVEAIYALLLGDARISQSESFKRQLRTHSLLFTTTSSGVTTARDLDRPLPPAKPTKLKPPKRKPKSKPGTDTTPTLLPDLHELHPSVESGPYNITICSTFHPANVLRDMNRIAAVEAHTTLLRNFLTGHSPTITVPHIIPVRPPLTT